MKKLIISLILLLITGCTSFNLDSKWLPLKKIQKRPSLGSNYASTFTTIGDKLYYQNPEKYLKQNPPGSAKFDSLLYHEQIHSKRQFKIGVAKWILKYLCNTDFMWREEQLGWYAEIKNLMRRGLRINPQAIAVSLKGYKNLKGRMVSYNDALKWVNDVISNRWKPNKEDLWSMPDFLKDYR